MSYLMLPASFAILLAGALMFTNAIEWFGSLVHLGQGAVGSLLAADRGRGGAARRLRPLRDLDAPAQRAGRGGGGVEPVDPRHDSHRPSRDDDRRRPARDC